MKKQIMFFIFAMLFQTAFAQPNCTKSGAYAAGFNDERQGLPMKQDYADSCWGNHDLLNQYYNYGYVAAAKIDNNPIQPSVPQQCIQSFGKQVCGYNCVNTGLNAQCATTPDQTCVKDNFGDIACGYGCASNAFKVKCASSPGESCIADNFNNIVCGSNCRIEFGQAVCDQ